MLMAEEDGWLHFLIVGGCLIMGLVLVAIVFSLFLALWQAGVGVFVVTLLVVFGFCWIVSKIVYVGRKNGWFDKL